MVEEQKTPEISVILPVYNMADYIDECMQSIQAQTFSDLEILMINDGSTDDSAQKCLAWAARDGRIRYYSQSNRGVAAARNLGVRLARGRYLAFVDPDDWLDPTYFEKLRRPLEETQADFSECDLWRVNGRTGEKIYRSSYGVMGEDYTLRERMKYAPTATYKSMSRRSLWESWQIRMPECAFESPAIYALVVALSGRVESIREPLYYYRRFRANSLIENGYAAADGTPDPALGVEAMRFLLSEFRRCGIYDTYADTLEGVVKYRLSDILAMQFHRRSDREYRLLADNCRAFLQQAFPDGRNAPYVTWGGYNLNRVLTHMDWLHDPNCRFNFSSIISVAWDRPGKLPPFAHKNSYRRIMLERERTRQLWETLARVRPDFFFMDLMDDRFDVLETDGGYITASDALEGAANRPMGRRISRNSREWMELWRRSAECFVDAVRAAVPEIRFVIVESLLSEQVGDLSERRPFPELEEIHSENDRLRECYDYLETLCSDAVILRPEGSRLYFTDRNYEYGAVPSHLNELFNRELARAIEEKLTAAGY